MRFINGLADRALARLVPARTASAACSGTTFQDKYVACPNGLRYCWRYCTVQPNCSVVCPAWNCGGCNQA